MLNEPAPENPLALIDPHNISEEALAEVGLESLVYVRGMAASELTSEIQGQIDVAPETVLYCVYSANGTQLAIVDSWRGAVEGARAYGYEAVSVH